MPSVSDAVSAASQAAGHAAAQQAAQAVSAATQAAPPAAADAVASASHAAAAAAGRWLPFTTSSWCPMVYLAILALLVGMVWRIVVILRSPAQPYPLTPVPGGRGPACLPLSGTLSA